MHIIEPQKRKGRESHYFYYSPIYFILIVNQILLIRAYIWIAVQHYIISHSTII